MRKQITASEVLEARENEEAFEKLLTENKGHIRYRVYRTTHRVVTEDDDEWSVAEVAFWEAVRDFDDSKGDFMKFADMVITRRVIDSIRQNAKYNMEVPVDPDDALKDIEADETVENEREFEVEALSQDLSGYGIRFADLVSCSPRSEKTRRACAAAVDMVIEDRKLYDEMRDRRELPIKAITENTGIPRKTVERHRRYIIAAAEILSGDYPCLSEYMGYIRDYRKNKGRK